MSSSLLSSSAGPQRIGTTWLDVALLLVVAVVTSAAGAAAQSVWDLPWDPAGPPAASAAIRQQLAEAQQRARDLSLSRDTFAAQAAQERVDRTVSAVRLQLATGQAAVLLGANIRESDLVIGRLQDQVAAAVRAGVDVDQQVAAATEDVTKSRVAAERRSRWITAGDRSLFGVAAW